MHACRSTLEDPTATAALCTGALLGVIGTGEAIAAGALITPEPTTEALSTDWAPAPARTHELTLLADTGAQDGYYVSSLDLQLALETPCETEDSLNCHWLGGENGLGLHLVNVAGLTFIAPAV